MSFVSATHCVKSLQHGNHVNQQNKIYLIETVNQAATNYSWIKICSRVLLNIKKRSKLFVEQKGGHFEDLLKLKNYENEK